MDWQLVASYFTVKSTDIFYSVVVRKREKDEQKYVMCAIFRYSNILFLLSFESGWGTVEKFGLFYKLTLLHRRLPFMLK